MIAVISSEIAEANVNVDISLWKNEWICTPGLSFIQVEWDPDNSPTKIKINQQSVLTEFPAIKTLKLKIAFFDEEGSLLEVQDVTIHKETAEIEYKGATKAKTVFAGFLSR